MHPETAFDAEGCKANGKQGKCQIEGQAEGFRRQFQLSEKDLEEPQGKEPEHETDHPREMVRAETKVGMGGVLGFAFQKAAELPGEKPRQKVGQAGQTDLQQTGRVEDIHRHPMAR